MMLLEEIRFSFGKSAHDSAQTEPLRLLSLRDREPPLALLPQDRVAIERVLPVAVRDALLA